MAFKSKAQLEHFTKEWKAGRMSLQTIASMSRGTDLANLPERVNNEDDGEED